jgi:hypothetical protein
VHPVDEIGTIRLERAKVIRGNVVQIDYGGFIVNDKDGKAVRLNIDKKTQMNWTTQNVLRRRWVEEDS